jgi:HEAT repeat protein
VNWEAIGAVGEIIGAVAVVVSVAYLALQIRAQNVESRLGATRDLASKRAEPLKLLLGDDAAIEVWLKAVRDYESLQGHDRMKASLMFNLIMRNAEQDFLHKGTGHADDPYLESVDRVLSQNVSAPGLQEWWRTTGDLFNQSFQDHVNSLMATQQENRLNDAFADPNQ